MTLYKRKTRKAETLIARERAPLAATQNMFQGMPKRASRTGGLSVAVPGEVAGLWELHQKYGSLDWASLLEPVAKLCDDGHLVSRFLYSYLLSMKNTIQARPGLKNIFIDPATNEPYKLGQKIKRPDMARTIRTIARDGAPALYDGVLTEAFVKDIHDNGGIITKEDLKQYK